VRIFPRRIGYDCGTMNDEPALLAAIAADAADDTPRLVYADWLDEHDAPLQAAFVRAQCRLAAMSAADPDYADVLERHAEVSAQFGRFATHTLPKLPPGFTCDLTPDGILPHFRRGFLDAVQAEWHWSGTGDAADEAVVRVRDGLTELAATTARYLKLQNLRGEAIAGILAAPAAAALTGLTLQPADWSVGGATVLNALVKSPAAASLERLSVYSYTNTAVFAALAAGQFPRLAHLELSMLYGRAANLKPLFAAPWFQRLRSVRLGSAERAVEGAVVEALARLPHLDELDLRTQNPEATDALGAARGFRALAKLTMWLPHVINSARCAERLAKGTFPRLADLDLGNVRTPGVLALLGGKWLPQLRVLSIRHSRISDKSVVLLSKSPAAANLRVLRLDGTPVGKSAFAAVGDGERFPNLTTLSLATSDPRKMDAAALAAFAANLGLPRLRHLVLDGWPLGDAGAKALAANPSLANVTRLSLRGCGLGEKGLAALVRSRHLQGLIELDVADNRLKTAAALCDPSKLPRLAAARLSGNAIPDAARRKLHAARGLAV
jgi:uncharacterized protein (TIGR02996 family)